mmetsp:Transcript_38838/g.91622  ORF Transcript_38838/g.91622 Transcript_38838/m.91622 type:complete len:519 (-) Transcript_38838:397-1953(-)
MHRPLFQRPDANHFGHDDKVRCKRQLCDPQRSVDHMLRRPLGNLLAKRGVIGRDPLCLLGALIDRQRRPAVGSDRDEKDLGAGVIELDRGREVRDRRHQRVLCREIQMVLVLLVGKRWTLGRREHGPALRVALYHCRRHAVHLRLQLPDLLLDLHLCACRLQRCRARQRDMQERRDRPVVGPKHLMPPVSFAFGREERVDRAVQHPVAPGRRAFQTLALLFVREACAPALVLVGRDEAERGLDEAVERVPSLLRDVQLVELVQHLPVPLLHEAQHRLLRQVEAVVEISDPEHEVVVQDAQSVARRLAALLLLAALRVLLRRVPERGELREVHCAPKHPAPRLLDRRINLHRARCPVAIKGRCDVGHHKQILLLHRGRLVREVEVQAAHQLAVIFVALFCVCSLRRKMARDDTDPRSMQREPRGHAPFVAPLLQESCSQLHDFNVAQVRGEFCPDEHAEIDAHHLPSCHELVPLRSSERALDIHRPLSSLLFVCNQRLRAAQVLHFLQSENIHVDVVAV